MRVIGIDPSSSLSGVALIEHKYRDEVGQQLFWTKTWSKDKSKSAPENLYAYFRWLKDEALVQTDPKSPYLLPVADMACVEFLSVTRNAQTSRVVSHYQAASVLACKELGMTVIEARVSSARKEALGKNVDKETAHAKVKEMYPEHKFKSKTTGGMDETDAIVLALAARGLAER